EGPAPVAGRAALALVAAGREGLVARAAQDDHPDLLVLPRGAEGRDQLLDGLGTEGVSHLWPVDGDPCDAVAHLVQNVLVSHGPPRSDVVEPPRLRTQLGPEVGMRDRDQFAHSLAERFAAQPRDAVLGYDVVDQP